MSPTDVFYVLFVGSLGLAVTIQAQTCPRPTAALNTVLSDADIVKEEFADGEKATFVCVAGYEHEGGSRIITCTAGNWSLARMRCQKKDCGSPGEFDNGVFHIVGTEFGDTVTATCNDGYLMVGRGERHCLADGWSGRVPVCEVVKCSTLPEVGNSSHSPAKEVYDYRDIVVYKCNTGLTPNGSISLTCSEDGTFKPAAPNCLKVQCSAPNIPNAHWESGARPPYGHNSFVTYKCNPGFVMEGSSELTCGIDNKWTPREPKCVPAPTTTTKATTTTTTTTTTSPPIPKKTTESALVPGPGPGPVPVTPIPPSDGGNKVGVGIAIALGVVVIIGGAIFSGYYFITKKNRSKRPYGSDGPL